MSTTVNYPNPNQDRTTYIFDNFYNFETYVDTAVYDVVLSFFRTTFDDETAAKNFTLNLFRIADQSGSNPMEILESIRDQNGLELSSTFAYYLNNLRSNSTLLGINQVVTPTFYASRNVLI